MQSSIIHTPRRGHCQPHWAPADLPQSVLQRFSCKRLIRMPCVPAAAAGKCWLVGCGPGSADHLTVSALMHAAIFVADFYVQSYGMCQSSFFMQDASCVLLQLPLMSACMSCIDTLLQRSAVVCHMISMIPWRDYEVFSCMWHFGTASTAIAGCMPLCIMTAWWCMTER